MATKKTIRFFSREEYRALKTFIQSKSRIKRSELTDFCKKYNRSLNSTCLYIHRMRKNKKYGRAERNSTKKNSLIIPTTSKKGQFKVPINDWNINYENGKMYFTVNF